MSHSPTHPETREIDFLPARFREQSVQRSVHLWRVVLLAFFAALLPALSIYQYYAAGNVRGQLSNLRVLYNKAKIEELRLNQLQEQLAEASAAAELYTFLDHPWPTSQILVAVTRDMPPAITLSELDAHAVADETVTSAERLAERQSLNGQATPGVVLATSQPAQRDHQLLREKSESVRLVISLVGETLDTTALYSYIGELTEEPLFERAELESVEAPQDKNHSAAKFRARIYVRPGYGLPEGPRGGDAELARASALPFEVTQVSRPSDSGSRGGNPRDENSSREDDRVEPSPHPEQRGTEREAAQN